VLDVLLLLLLAAFVAGAWTLLQRSEPSATAFWVTGWIFAGASGLLTVLGDELHLALLLAYPLGSLFVAMLLAGALALAGRRVPRWLPPAALAWGLARGALAAAGLPRAAYTAALVVEPLLVLAAGWIAARATPARGATSAQRMLGPAFVVLAAAGAIHLVWLQGGGEVPAGLFALWMLAAPPVLFVQVQADWERTRCELRAARERLEERVAARTAELAAANASLRAEVSERRAAEEEQRRLELRVQQAQRLESLGTLTGGVAHDFNNLLAVILGNVRVALDDLPEDSPLRARLLRVRAAAEHGAELTTQMLAYSGEASVELKPVDLSLLVEGTRDLLHAAVAEECEIEYELPPGLVAEGDATQLRQVLLNLVRNAGEALPGGRGRVRVRTGRAQLGAADLADAHGALDVEPGAYLLIEVSDDGVGMDAATQQRIFEPFFTTRFSGRGLGLAAVLGIVQAHRGLIQVESTPGEGSTLRVLLPQPGAAFDAAASDAAPPARSATVLVVDDDPAVLEVAEAFLQRAGHRVLAATSGAAALAWLRERGDEIDVAVLDLAMPDADGGQVLLDLHRLRPALPVVIATGYGAERAAARLPAGAAAGFVSKPFAPGELEAQVRAALGDVRREVEKLR
jgi:signal transduction histidine kinase/ActR/RegA family two-component response regulator